MRVPEGRAVPLATNGCSRAGEEVFLVFAEFLGRGREIS